MLNAGDALNQGDSDKKETNVYQEMKTEHIL